ncbi:MAG: hypothetical protein ACREXY_05205, partial [Gammaproteobacteria bacterium]
LYALIFPVVRRAMRSLMRIDAENAARSESQLRTALVHLNEGDHGGVFDGGDDLQRTAAVRAVLNIVGVRYEPNIPWRHVGLRPRHAMQRV